jgi:phosphatidylglycerol:prolipoprotein diacylglycerol transferase
MLDLIVYGLLIGQILGRWGNFMNREAFGAETEIFCRMQLTAPDGSSVCVHPTFLYESLWNLIGLIGLIVWERRGGRRYDGQAALGYFFWYGVGRAWIEGLRTDSLYIAGTSLRVSQLLSIVLALASLVLLVVNARKKHPPEELYVNKVAAAAAEIVTSEDGEEKRT